MTLYYIENVSQEDERMFVIAGNGKSCFHAFGPVPTLFETIEQAGRVIASYVELVKDRAPADRDGLIVLPLNL